MFLYCNLNFHSLEATLTLSRVYVRVLLLFAEGKGCGTLTHTAVSVLSFCLSF